MGSGNCKMCQNKGNPSQYEILDTHQSNQLQKLERNMIYELDSPQEQEETQFRVPNKLFKLKQEDLKLLSQDQESDVQCLNCEFQTIMSEKELSKQEMNQTKKQVENLAQSDQNQQQQQTKLNSLHNSPINQNQSTEEKKQYFPQQKSKDQPTEQSASTGLFPLNQKQQSPKGSIDQSFKNQSIKQSSFRLKSPGQSLDSNFQEKHSQRGSIKKREDSKSNHSNRNNLSPEVSPKHPIEELEGFGSPANKGILKLKCFDNESVCSSRRSGRSSKSPKKVRFNQKVQVQKITSKSSFNLKRNQN